MLLLTLVEKSSFLEKKKQKILADPPKPQKILSSPPAWIRKIFHTEKTFSFRGAQELKILDILGTLSAFTSFTLT